MTKIIQNDELPLVCILFTTYNRTEYALQALQEAQERLKYDGQLMWYVADAGSEMKHLEQIDSVLPSEARLGQHSRKGLSPGKNWNLGIKNIFEQTPIYLRLEDDFVLNRVEELRSGDVKEWRS